MEATTTAGIDNMAQETPVVTEPSAADSIVTPNMANGEDLVVGGAAEAPAEGVSSKETSPSLPASTEEEAKAADADPKVKDSSRQRKKEDKSIEHILKALNSLQTPEEKLAALCKKYADLHEEHRLLQGKFKQGQKKLTTVIREKDQLQTEHSKAVLAKSKLESLCRELQRHNKLVKEESLARAREEDEKRKEVTTKFQITIGEIQTQMNDHYAKNTKLREENLELANKLKGLIEQYEQREQHIEKVLKHKDLEQQLGEARLQQINLQLKEEHEKNIAEKQHMVQDSLDAHKKITIMEEQEKQLRNQVALYAEKYEEFQSTLAKSNDVFQSFKTEMDKMTKKIKKLEKETTMWRSRWENSNKALLEMAEEKTRSDKEHITLQTKIKKLESLCRALQQERNKKGDGSVLSSREGSESPKLELESSESVVNTEAVCNADSTDPSNATGPPDSGLTQSQGETEDSGQETKAKSEGENENGVVTEASDGALNGDPSEETETPSVQPEAVQVTEALSNISLQEKGSTDTSQSQPGSEACSQSEAPLEQAAQVDEVSSTVEGSSVNAEC